MAGIDRAQPSISLRPAQFADDDAVGPHPECRLQKIIGGYSCFPEITLDRNQTYCISQRQLKLGRVLDYNQPLFLRKITLSWSS
jgi:hypothetical protein